MAAARSNVNGGHWFDRITGAVEFDFTFTLEDQIDFGHLLVEMGARIFLDVDQVERGGGAWKLGKGPASGTARAAFGGNLVEVGDGEICHAGNLAFMGEGANKELRT